ncbi:MAG: S1 RNA-binding domain-containing protein [Nitrospiraceae bacterium]|nr:S1 RNA-binding domain-containing protein [Nitrospiraceae bacterium]
MIEAKYVELIATGLSLDPAKVAAAIELLDAGATLPFIARYRKDATGGMTIEQAEAVADRNNYYIGVTNRRKAVLENLEKQHKLTDALREQIESATDKTRLEDLYIPFKSKRATKATMSEQQGLGELADFVLKQLPGLQSIEEYANAFVKPEKGISSPEEAFEGALYILVERFAADPDARAEVRNRMLQEGTITARPTKNTEGKRTKYETYYNFSEPVDKIPSHRMLAITRGVKEGLLRVDVTLDDERLLGDLLPRFLSESGSVFEQYIRLALQEAYTRHLRPAIENEVMELLRKRADDDAIRVFRENARNLLLSAPAGAIGVIAAVPTPKNGCKLAILDPDSGFVGHQTLFLSDDEAEQSANEQRLLALIDQHGVRGIALANTQGAGAITKLVKSVIAKSEREDLFAVSVNAGPATSYATSRTGRDEFPDLESAVREAIALGRRLQDPLAELAKVEPRSIGVGQYQHDINQKQLREGLQRTLVACVNAVGVNLNTASAPLLRYISGIQMGTAQNIVDARVKAGGFTSRAQLLEIDGIGPKVFEQCAGFLRIPGTAQPLDATAIHPEAYEDVERIAQSIDTSVGGLLGNSEKIGTIDFSQFETDTLGKKALADIRRELLTPGRDIRAKFKVPKLVEGVSSLDDLEEGMELEGTVTNVTNFGAFIDVGVQQDGLVHLSEISNRFVKDPRDIINIGQVVKVKVIKVDKEQPRISLSMKALEPARPKRPPRRRPARPQAGEKTAPVDGKPAPDANQPERPPRRRPRDGERSRSDGPPRERERREGGAKRASGGKGGRDSGRTQRPPRRGRDRGAAIPKGYKQDGGGEPLNTLLADQLAALKDKLDS